MKENNKGIRGRTKEKISKVVVQVLALISMSSISWYTLLNKRLYMPLNGVNYYMELEKSKPLLYSLLKIPYGESLTTVSPAICAVFALLLLGPLTQLCGVLSHKRGTYICTPFIALFIYAPVGAVNVVSISKLSKYFVGIDEWLFNNMSGSGMLILLFVYALMYFGFVTLWLGTLKDKNTAAIKKAEKERKKADKRKRKLKTTNCSVNKKKTENTVTSKVANATATSKDVKPHIVSEPNANQTANRTDKKSVDEYEGMWIDVSFKGITTRTTSSAIAKADKLIEEEEQEVKKLRRKYEELTKICTYKA